MDGRKRVKKINILIFIIDMTQEEFKTIIINADTDKYLTQSADVAIEDRIIATTIALGKNDSVDNWKEITKAEGDALKAQKEEAINSKNI